jgi:hypothetical protein
VRPRIAPIDLVTLCSLGLSPGACSQTLPRELEGAGSSLALMNGRGTAAVHSGSGSLLGTLRKGRITVFDRPAGAKTTVRFWGCEERRRPTPRKTVCIGRGLRVSVLSGSWITTFKGRRVNASAVAEGRLRLRGTRGTFAIDGVSRSWPTVFRTYDLG